MLLPWQPDGLIRQGLKAYPVGQMKDSGIIVLGTPRSGTTLLRRILDAHPRIACPGETCVLSASARFLRSETMADGIEYGVLNGLAFAGFERQEVLQRLRSFAFSFHQDYASRMGKARWAEKTAVDTFYIPEIEQLCGDQLQFIGITRHGLDVACSLQEFSSRGGTYLAELHDYIRRYPRMLEAFAHAWVDSNEALLDFCTRHPDTSLLVRYEDLLSDPARVVGDIFAFLGEQHDENILAKAFGSPLQAGFGDWKAYQREKLDSGSIDRWRTLPKSTASRLANICNDTLGKFGYAQVPVFPPDSDEAARKRFEFSLAFGSGFKKD